MKNKYLKSLILGIDEDSSYFEVILHYFVFRVLGSVLLLLLVALYSDSHKDGEGNFIPILGSVLLVSIVVNIFYFIGATNDYFKKAKSKKLNSNK